MALNKGVRREQPAPASWIYLLTAMRQFRAVRFVWVVRLVWAVGLVPIALDIFQICAEILSIPLQVQPILFEILHVAA